jgi:DNA polymerase III gamma/tau subunit
MEIIKKYQPKNFDEFIGNNNIINTLKSISKQEKIPNIMLSGNLGTGKTLLMNLFVQSLNIKQENILRVNLNEDLKKNNIKNSKLFNFLKKPIRNLIIIDNYEEIALEQQYIIRSFLKNYNKNSIFLIFLNNTSNIIEHLTHYFLIFKMKPNTNRDYMKFLKKIVKGENINISNYILKYIIEISHNFREIINNLTIVLNYYKSKNEVKNKDLEIILNITDKKYTKKMILYCDKKDIHSAIKLVDNLLNNGYSVTDLINMLTIHIRYNNDIIYEKKIKYIEIISFGQIKMINNLNTYTQFIALLAKMCKV